jgi:3-keto-disaccharide hydrolase
MDPNAMKTSCSLAILIVVGAIANLSWAEAAEAKKKAQPKPDADGWYNLFDGKDLDGWKKSTDNPDTIKVVDGEIVIRGKVCHLYYDGPVKDANFKNFEWKCDVLTKPHSNSGMYFHTHYQAEGFPKTGIEVQVNNSHTDPIRTGSLYRLKDIMNNSPAKDNEWFTQTVIVDGNQITVKINDKVVNEYTWKEGETRTGGFEHNLLDSGTFALQGHDPGSEVHYKNIKVKPLP